MIPPSLLLIRIGRVPIVIPLLLLWPIALALLAVGLPVSLLLLLFTFRPRKAWLALVAVGWIYAFFTAFRGLNINVKGRNRWVQIKVL
ncbi:MAG: hypothetical protein HQ478_14365 [Chloroflexi bacterium]|nr:hypothetical protein [Chloroflexota bacterium]